MPNSDSRIPLFANAGSRVNLAQLRGVNAMPGYWGLLASSRPVLGLLAIEVGFRENRAASGTRSGIPLGSRALKKLITSAKWKRYLSARSRSQQTANARFGFHERERHTKSLFRHRIHRFKKQGTVRAPDNFSLIQNSNETIGFLDQIKKTAQSRNVFVDLSGVKTITPDAICGLLATIHQRRIEPAMVSGNVPRERGAAELVENSGFREHVHTPGGSRYEPRKGMVRKQQSVEAFQTRFDRMLAKELVEFGTEKLFGVSRPNGPSFSVLTEGMLNTLNHASKIPGTKEPWWASVYYDVERQRACFTFIDRGVGIFESYSIIQAVKMRMELVTLSRAGILKSLFQGQVTSSSGEPGRGNGIPRMYDHAKALRIRNLTVVTNNVKGEAEHDRYEMLDASYQGTLLYWEMVP
jgi:hypothetical protein